MNRYDVLVIGSGKGGKTLAMKLAGDGASVGLIFSHPTMAEAISDWLYR
jgi:pyruvate/2-oxoglutarate dehydrogenase complex dihydrolipoamide dehydrogenase (E3) component